jgi:hypothetical protein
MQLGHRAMVFPEKFFQNRPPAQPVRSSVWQHLAVPVPKLKYSMPSRGLAWQRVPLPAPAEKTVHAVRGKNVPVWKWITPPEQPRVMGMVQRKRWEVQSRSRLMVTWSLRQPKCRAMRADPSPLDPDADGIAREVLQQGETRMP